MRRLFKLFLAVVAFVIAGVSLAKGQSVDMNRPICANSDPTKPRALVIVPIASLQVPLCLVIGPGLRINMNAPGGPALETTVIGTLLPVPVVETIQLDPVTVPLTQTRLTYRLSKLPALNSFLTIIFRSVSWPGDIVEVIPNPVRDLDIALPSWRSQSAGDKLELRYFMVPDLGTTISR